MNFSKRHQHYKDSAATWAKLSAALTGQGVENWCRRARTEGQKDFAERQEAAAQVFRDYPAQALSLYSSAIFAKPPVRELPKELTRFLDDVDRAGTNADDFFRRVTEQALLFGAYFVGVDLPALAEGETPPKTKADQEATRFYPYMVGLEPSQVLDWAVDGDGNLLWVSIVSTHQEGEDKPFEEPKTLPAVLVWERHHFTKWVERGGKLEPVLGPSPNPFGVVPVVPFYGERVAAMQGRSQVLTVANLSLDLMNTMSLLGVALQYAAVPQLVIQTHANMPNIAMGHTKAIPLDPGDKASYLHLPREAVTALLESAATTRRDIRDAVFRKISLTMESAQRETEGAKRLDLDALHSFISNVAQSMAESEAKVWQLMAKGMGMNSANVTINYNRRYDLRSASERLDEALKASALGLPSPTFRATYQAQLVQSLLEDAAPEIIQAAVQELEQAEGA